MEEEEESPRRSPDGCRRTDKPRRRRRSRSRSPRRTTHIRKTCTDYLLASIKPSVTKTRLLPFPATLPHPEPVTVVENAGRDTISLEMETVIQQLVKGQERLEWVAEQQLNSAQADREILKKVLEPRVDPPQPWVDPPYCQQEVGKSVSYLMGLLQCPCRNTTPARTPTPSCSTLKELHVHADGQ